MATSPKSVAADAQGSSSKTSPMTSVVRNGRTGLLGDLPDDFLRIKPSAEQAQIAADHQAALSLQRQMQTRQQMVSTIPMNIVGRLDLTIIEARLVKNYGVTRMDPYVRLRVGHQVYETKTAINGARNPVWNKVFHCFLPKGVNAFHLEVFDERAFSEDERIAWVDHKISQEVFQGETKEEWIELSGKQGEGKEGHIGIVMTFTAISNSAPLMNTGIVIPMAGAVQPINLTENARMAPFTRPVATTNLPNVHVDRTRSPPVHIPTEEDINQLREMFPSVDIEVIKAILETEGGNKTRAINSLLAMSN